MPATKVQRQKSGRNSAVIYARVSHKSQPEDKMSISENTDEWAPTVNATDWRWWPASKRRARAGPRSARSSTERLPIAVVGLGDPRFAGSNTLLHHLKALSTREWARAQ